MNIKQVISAVVIATILTSVPVKQATASANPYIGEIMWVGFRFCPRGWANADGQLLAVSQNPALFSLLGTNYGGDGRTTFGLPDLRGRVSIHNGTGPGLSPYLLGQRGGVEEVTLSVNQMPAHNHAFNASPGTSDNNAAGSILGSPRKQIFDAPPAAIVTLDNSAVDDTGGSAAHENRPPYLVLQACIALRGVFPSRS